MKTQKTRRESAKLSVSLPPEMAAWLRREAAASDSPGNVSAILRRLLWDAYQQGRSARKSQN